MYGKWTALFCLRRSEDFGELSLMNLMDGRMIVCLLIDWFHVHSRVTITPSSLFRPTVCWSAHSSPTHASSIVLTTPTLPTSPTVSPRPSRRRRHAVRRSRPPRLRPQRPLSDTRTPLEGTHCARERWRGRRNWDFPHSFSFFPFPSFPSLSSFLYVQYLFCNGYSDEYKMQCEREIVWLLVFLSKYFSVIFYGREC